MINEKVVTYVFVSKMYGAQQYLSVNEDERAYMIGNIQSTGFDTFNRVEAKLKDVKRLTNMYERWGFKKYTDETTKETRRIFHY